MKSCRSEVGQKSPMDRVGLFSGTSMFLFVHWPVGLTDLYCVGASGGGKTCSLVAASVGKPVTFQTLAGARYCAWHSAGRLSV